jgi:GntR family transcriptional regulator
LPSVAYCFVSFFASVAEVIAAAMTKSASARAHRRRRPTAGNNGTLYKSIVRVLQKEIVSGKHPVGARLPTESALCRRFSVSRHTVREALRHLRESGLVSPRQGSGTTVAAAEPSFYLHPVASVTDLMQYAVHHRFAGPNFMCTPPTRAFAR